MIKAVHYAELRTALDQALVAFGLPIGGYTDSTLVNVKVKAIHVAEIRNRVR